MINKLILAAIILLLNSGICYADPVFYDEWNTGQTIDMSIISKIESNNNPLAVSHCGATGQYQVMSCVLKEYNKYHSTYYTMINMRNPISCYKVAHWYLNIRIPQMLKHYHKPITVDYILWAYNAGIGNLLKGIKPRETRNYIRKYHREEVK